MAPPVPRAGSRVRGGPAPRCPTSSGATLSLSRGGRPGGPARGGAAHLPASAQSPAHLGGPARPSTAAGARGVTEGARRESGRGGATSLPPSAGRPGELASAYPAVPKRAGFSRSRPLPRWYWPGLRRGHRPSVRVAATLPQKGTEFSESPHLSSAFISPPATAPASRQRRIVCCVCPSAHGARVAASLYSRFHFPQRAGGNPAEP